MPEICDWAAGLPPSHLRLGFIVLTRRLMLQLGSYPSFYNGEALRPQVCQERGVRLWGDAHQDPQEENKKTAYRADSLILN